MDLRGYSIPDDLAQRLRRDRDENVMWYQPFVFRDDLMVGTGAFWNSGGVARSYIYLPGDPEPVRQAFILENNLLSNWYDALADMVVDCFPAAQNVLDLGCNCGRVCFALAQRGVSPTGVDVWDRCYETVRDITGISFEYIHDAYDSMTHRVESLEGRTFDAALAIAVSTHLTDPHYFIRYLSDLAPNGGVVATPIVPGGEYEASWKVRVPNWRRERTLPDLIEFFPTACAMELMLQSVHRYVYRQGARPTDPKNIRNAWGVWVVSATPIPNPILEKHALTLVPPRLDRVADAPLPFQAMPVVTPEAGTVTA